MNIDLIQGETLEEMQKLIDGGVKVDMILADLPYGTTACKWDAVIPFDKMWEQLNRVIKPTGAIVLFGSQPFTSALIMSNPKLFRYELIWEKDSPSNIFFAQVQPLKYHENILIFSKAKAHNQAKLKMEYIPQMEVRKEKNKRNNNVRNNNKSKIFGDGREFNCQKKIGNEDLIYPKSVKFFNRVRNGVHNTQKPVELMEYLIKTYTNENETVLDFTMGSGTTGVACKNLNRNFIGIELDNKYFKIAEKRINKTQVQTKLV